MTTPTRPRPQPVQEDQERQERHFDQSMRARQLASTVRQGRKITIQIIDEYPFSCYLCGWDDDTYFVILPSSNKDGNPVKRLVPKASVQYIDLDDERTFREEPDFEKMAPIVNPFKSVIGKLYFNGKRDTQDAQETE